MCPNGSAKSITDPERAPDEARAPASILLAPAGPPIMWHTPFRTNRERREMNVATRVSEQDGCVVVSVDGELDLGTAEQLQETLTTAIAEAAGPIVLDLTDLRFCDSAGLAVLVKAHNTLSDQGRRLVLARPTTAVSRVLELSGLDQVIATAPSPDEARAIATRP